MALTLDLHGPAQLLTGIFPLADFFFPGQFSYRPRATTERRAPLGCWAPKHGNRLWIDRRLAISRAIRFLPLQELWAFTCTRSEGP